MGALHHRLPNSQFQRHDDRAKSNRILAAQKNANCCSNNAYVSQVYTKRFTAEVMVEDGGFTREILVEGRLADPDPLVAVESVPTG